jgi:uncharacterized protein (TIGR03067 family)
LVACALSGKVNRRINLKTTLAAENDPTVLAEIPMRWCLLPLVVAGFSLAAAAGAQGGAKDDQERIQGTWQVRSDEDGGRKAPDEAIKDIKWVITGDKITYKVVDKTTLTYKLEPTKKPKWIDFTRSGRTTFGIYDLDEDNLKICFPKGGKGKRPTAFESKADSRDDVLIILKRER